MRRARKDRQPLTRGQRLWGLTKALLFAGFLGCVGTVGGFIEFTRQVGAQTPPDPVPEADGIVVWTGPGGGRLEAGTELLQQGKGERLLISGVNVQNSRQDVAALLTLTEAEESCCLDLDYAAIDTVGNAVETASWAEALGYEHIILVTSDYHMPGAQIEISSRIGPIRITPYPVISDQSGPWWRNRAQFDRLAREYGKLLHSFLRRPRQGRAQTPPVIIPDPDTPPPDSEPESETP